ncbi:septum formation protein Maf [bacterium 1XD42-8]|jgi:septum formation protein|nr:septum formation protein Maf [Lachnospiraceae bacterium]RKJ50907.1 septum formation protein Maf [bacterium 1XD42-8]
MNNKCKFILASSSPRRKEIFNQIGMRPYIWPSHCEEVITKTIPFEVGEQLSRQKAEEIFQRAEKEEGAQSILILGADTIVAKGNKIMGKPKGEEEAKEMLLFLQGGSHEVYTGATLIYKRGREKREVTFHEKTEVFVYPMSIKEIEEYISTGEPMDKAGAYGIQGVFAQYIEKIHGDFYNVAGLPIGRIRREMKKLIGEEEE